MRLCLGTALFALACLTLAGCANTTGGSSTMPGGQLPSLANPAVPVASPTATPAIASGLIKVTPGSTLTLPAPGDYKVTAIFPPSSAAPASTASPASSASPSGSASPAVSAKPESTASPTMLNATVSIPGPPGIPAFGATKKKGFLFGSHRELGPVLLYVWFSSDKSVTLASLPSLQFTIPLSALEPYGTDPDLRLAIYDPANENRWTEGIATRVAVTPSPTPSGTETPTPTPSPTPTPTPSATATASRPPGVPAPPPTPIPAPSVVATLRPPVQTTAVGFAPNPRVMKLLAKKNLVFVLYVEPAATETPTPKPTPSVKASAAPSVTPSAGPSASPSVLPSESPTAAPSASPASTPVSSASP